MAKLHLLVVDDEDGIRSGVRRILENYTVSYPFMEEDFEFEIIEAATGEEAIQIIDNNHIDIVLLDNKLPGMQGVEVLEYIHQKRSDILVVMITSYASLELAVSATRKGAFDFVPKPFTPAELRTSIETISKQLFLKRMTKKLTDEGKQIRFQFLSLLSHELKAPLNAIEGYLRLMNNRTAGNDINNYDDMIKRSLSRVEGMRNLIFDLLDFTKIESGKKTRHITQVELHKIITTAIDTFKPLAIQRDIDVHMRCPKNLIFKCDASEMEIIFNNLISNAIKYNKVKGRVDVIVEDESDHILITVADNGIGISEEDKEKIFQDFVRIKNEKTRNIAGTGLGLTIVKKIVALYNGDIQLDSAIDKGTTFKITLKKL